MILITLESDQQYTWELDQISPITEEQVNQVKHIKIDGQELLYVIENVHRLIFTRDEVVLRVYGDQAKLIVGNLIL